MCEKERQLRERERERITFSVVFLLSKSRAEVKGEVDEGSLEEEGVH